MVALNSDEADISADISVCLCSVTSFLQGWLQKRSTLSMRMWHFSHWMTSKACLCNSFGSRLVVDFTASKSKVLSFFNILMGNAIRTRHVYMHRKTYICPYADRNARSLKHKHWHTPFPVLTKTYTLHVQPTCYTSVKNKLWEHKKLINHINKETKRD